MEFAHGTIRRVGAAAVLTLVTLGVTPVGAADVILDATTGKRVGAFVVVNDAAASNGTAVTPTSRARKWSPPSRSRPTISNCPSSGYRRHAVSLVGADAGIEQRLGERLDTRAVHQRQHRGDWDHEV